jgi:hypothetical protein
MSKPIAALWALLLLTSCVDDVTFRPISFGSDAAGAGAVGKRAPRNAEAFGKPAADGWFGSSRAPAPSAALIDRAAPSAFEVSLAFWQELERARVRRALARARVVTVRGPPDGLSDF